MTFRDLHQTGNPFILANAWDIGSAKMLARLGAKAIATSSAAHAFTLGRADMGTISRDESLSHAQNLIAAVKIPVSGDFENGFGDDPDTCAQTVRLAGEIGLAGISIEDVALPATNAYDFALSVERIRAAAAAARSLPNDFVLVARADGVMNGRYDINEAMRRIKACEDAGADCLLSRIRAALMIWRAFVHRPVCPLMRWRRGRLTKSAAASLPKLAWRVFHWGRPLRGSPTGQSMTMRLPCLIMVIFPNWPIAFRQKKWMN